MKKIYIFILCCCLILLHLFPCLAATDESRKEVTQDGSYFIISDTPLHTDFDSPDTPGDPDNNATAPGSPDDSVIQETENGNSLLQLLKKIINALLRIFGRMTNQTELTKTKYLYYYSSDSQLLWSALLTGEFMYSSSSVRCMDAVFSFTSYDRNWKLIDYSCKSNNATASATFSVAHTSLGVHLQTIEKTLTLTCDTNGNVT